MTDEIENDPVFAFVAKLKRRDLHVRRADALRLRCHRVLQARARQSESVSKRQRTLFQQSVAPAVVVVWCVAYLLEIIRRAAAVYGF